MASPPPPPSTNNTTADTASKKSPSPLPSSPATIQPDGIPLKLSISPPKFGDSYEEKLKERIYLKKRLACAFRIFARYGFDEGVAGHITVRDPLIPTTFWVNPFGLHFSLIKSSDLILVSHDGTVHPTLSGPNKMLNRAAFTIHSAIHKVRKDVNCAAHSHSVYGRSFCALGKNLDMITQDSCAFYEDVALFPRFNGLVLGESEGKEIAQCLGKKKAALLQNHGLLTTGQTIEEAIFWFISLDKCCHSQLLADAAGTTVKIGPEEAAFSYRAVGTPLAGWFSGKALFDKVELEEGKVFADE